MFQSQLLAVAACLLVGFGETAVPPEIQQPGTQPGQVPALVSSDTCLLCHGGYDQQVEPGHNWLGGMMANAGRDPIFWATMAIAEQDFAGSGDLCLRCHSTGGWLAGRSTPTDGSALTSADADGVACEFCHKLTNPDDSEHLGNQSAPFIANDGGEPASGYYGSGMTSVWGGMARLGPYADAGGGHPILQSSFHRSVDFCGTCHDVSNPAVGDLAHNQGAQTTADPVISSGDLGGPVEDKAAFNNFPYQYGVMERTFSEYKAGLLPQTRVSDYSTLPLDLQAGAIRDAYESALGTGPGGDYEDGTPRYFSCQTCHMRAVTGRGSLGNAPTRQDLPLHDLTGGNYWMPDVIQLMDAQGKLRLGGGLDSAQKAAMEGAKARARDQLSKAASLVVDGDTLKVINLTGHKLISGYPEGRRMWLHIQWYDESRSLLREDGAYGSLQLEMDLDGDGKNDQVDTILDLDDSRLMVYEAHYGLTQEWAQQLLDLGYPSSLALSYDRIDGEVVFTLGDLVAAGTGAQHESFRFVLNNTVLRDNRIPPYGMSYDEARKRNALPVPADQYGGAPGGTYVYWDEVSLDPPSGAVSADIDLLYQPTSWEYIQFLYLANARQSAFLGNEGSYLLEAWLATDMAKPHVMSSATWTASSSGCVADDTTLCFAEGRFRVEVDWRDFQDRLGPGRVVEGASRDSGLMWFFDPDNWEMLIKVLDGCAVNDRFWVFSAATTNVEYTLQVTDTQTGAVKQYTNDLGSAAAALTDTGAFTCP